MKHSRILIVPAALAFALSLSACGGQAQDLPSTAAPTTAASTSQAPSSPESSPSSPGSQASQGTATQLPDAANTAIQTVLAEHPGTAIGLDLDQRDNTWKVKVLSEDQSTTVEVRTNGDGTEITRVEHENTAEAKHKQAAAASVDLLTAIHRVMAKYPGEFDEAGVDSDNGAIFWSVEINNGKNGEDAEMRVDLSSGEMSEDS